MPRLANRVLVIGWDAADWDVIRPLMAAGRMPALAGLVDRGVHGNIATLDPPFSPMLWTSIATGKTAEKHGVVGFTQPKADGDGVQPVLGTSRTAKAFWNIAHQSGLRSNVIGWWPSHPAEPVDGVMVSNFFHRMRGPVWAPDPPTQGAVHPPELAPFLEALRVHPDEITPEMVIPFVPSFAEAPPQNDGEQRAADAIARMLAETATVHAVATWAIEETEWDLTALYLDGIDHFSHSFMAYHPPQQSFVPDDLFARYREVIEGIYRFHDMMLGRLLALVDDDTAVVLVSDHGFESGPRRIPEIPDEPAGPAAEHRDFGVFVAAGPGICSGEQVYGASLLDVTPTLLTILGLPVGDDMDGRVLTPVFKHEDIVERIPSWEDIAGDAARLDADASDPWADQAAMDQLIALGYVDAPDDDGTVTAAVSRQESAYYLARVYLSKGMPGEAVGLVEPVWEEVRAERYGFTLLQSYEQLGRVDDAFSLCDELEELVREEGRAPDRPAPGLDLVRGRLYLANGEGDAAVAMLERAASVAGTAGPFLRTLGEAYLAVGRLDEAEAVLHRAAEADPEQPATLRLLAHVFLLTDRAEDARDLMLNALALRFFDPAGHYLLGQALMATGQHEAAAQALELAFAQRPTLASARFLLAQIYRDHLDRPIDAARLLAGAPSEAEARSVPQRPEDREVVKAERG
ncbi:alkaline phosphatase family protein [Rubrivirga sp. IMCC43871]|uniref:alkaline phosphatase family protein n=1 Tax=Rubrivirga sp. IMCC43871 TaxID=3391575 RepID=UPI00398FA4C1